MSYRLEKKIHILWAVDIICEPEAHILQTVQFLKTIEERVECEIQPVYLLHANQGSSESFNISLYSPEDVTGQTSESKKKAALKAFESLNLKSKLNSLGPLHVLIDSHVSFGNALKEFSRYVSEIGADFIIANTHAKRGLDKFLLGSFVESFVPISKIPVLVLNPKQSHFHSFQSLLFATDFSQHSWDALDYTVDLAKAMGLKIFLFHEVENILEPVASTGYALTGGMVSSISEKRAKECEDNLNEWAERVSKKGVSCTPCLFSFPGDVEKSILEEAQAKKVSLIGMASQSTKFSSFFSRSIAKGVFREAYSPVLVFGPQFKKEDKYKNRTQEIETDFLTDESGGAL